MNQKEIDALTGRVLLYKLISSGIDYPRQRLLDALCTDDYFDGFDEVITPLGGRLKQIAGAFRQDVLKECRQSDLESFEIEYNRIFQLSHVDACPLTACQYLKGESRQAMAVAQLRGLYRSFGVNTVPLREPDHLSSLCEFMSLLCAKELHAQKSGVLQRVDDCVAAQTIVVEDYLSFVPLLKTAIAAHTKWHFYLWIIDITVEFIALERDLLLLPSAAAN